MTVTPVLADQLEADGVAERLLEFCRRFRIESCEADAGDVELSARGRVRGRGRALPRGPGAPRGARRGPAAAVLGAGRRGPGRAARLRGHPRGPADARHPRRAAPCRSTPACARTGAASATCSGFWLPECAYEPGLERLLAAHGVELLLHRPERPRAADGGAGSGGDRSRAARRSRSTGRRSSGCGRSTATPPTPSSPTSIASRCAAPGRGRSAAAPTTRTRPRRVRASSGASSRPRQPRRLRGVRGRARSPGAARVRDRHRAARALVVGGARVARRGARGGRASTGSSW